ncbi:DUF4157 domain-containing protein [Geobacter pelophilus]|uniref:DUF4157 domain-containing protein n=1 Tax=Geoanaerobacter pelophilus TaxID=60036 RepID=A0AAW4L4T9_9BACT|nr:DUF4157 domain-containing protein [Geoanaerobacter pelophilus]MBT0665988.1 DUF4157 domain-containing protein [Geoanaerobacter pelophilus]
MTRNFSSKQADQSLPGQSTVSADSSRSCASTGSFAELQRAVENPLLASASAMLNLQRLAGNRAVAGLIQAKLTVTPPGDRLEREADSMANSVTGSAREAGPAIHRFEDEEIFQGNMAGVPDMTVEPAREVGAEVSSQTESRINASKGGGSRLPDEVRSYMEPRFGVDFSGVRLHTGSDAAQMNHELAAQAFTHGNDIYMGEGRFSPGTDAGRWLLAHELTHVVQQGGAASLAQSGDAVQRNGVTFPTYSDIVADATIKTEADKAWKETKTANTAQDRREQAFWIRWNSDTKAFSATGHSVGPRVKNSPPGGASVAPAARPADSGNDYTVGLFHTHTPTVSWAAGYQRNVGPSAVDTTYHNAQRVPGVVYDYTGVGGRVESGHPLDSAAKLWDCGPARRS